MSHFLILCGLVHFLMQLHVQDPFKIKLQTLKVSFSVHHLQSFRSLPQKPLSVDLTVEEGQRLKVIYGSLSGFHAVDVDSGTPYDLYLPTHVRISDRCFLPVHVSKDLFFLIFKLGGKKDFVTVTLQ